MGLLQGATELFPVSSLGHAVILPALLHWSFKESDPSFVPFLTLLHLGTAGALVVLYWRDWVAIVTGFFRAALRGRIQTPDERMAMLLVAGTIPVGLVGTFAESQIKHLFSSPRVAAAFLIVNGAVLFGAELLRRRDERRAAHAGADRVSQEQTYADADQLSFKAAVIVGAAQALALIPGISRSGITIAGGLVAGLRHQEAARFGFLLATPVILGAGVLQVPELLKPGIPFGAYLAGAVLAGLAAYASARFLIRWFRSGRLDPYAAYCVVAGVVALALLR